MNQTELIYEKTKGLTPFSYVLVGEWLYFCDQYTPGLFRYHFETEKSECVVRFDTHYVRMNFFKMIAYEDKIWLLPFLDGKIVCIILDTWKTIYYDIPEEIEEKTIPFFDIFFENGQAYITPHGNNRFLIKLDLVTHNIEKVQLFERKIMREKIFFNGAIQFQNYIYMMESSENVFVLFNTYNDQFEIIDFDGYYLDNFLSRRIEHEIYFFPITIKGNDNILVYDTNTRSISRKEYPIKNLLQGDICITETFGGEIWILANKRKKIYRMNHKLEIVSEISILNFNEEEKEIYVSGVAFADRFFWNGFVKTPLIQVRDNIVEILDVGKNQNLLEMYIEMISKGNAYGEKFDELNIGKAIYDNIVLCVDGI